MKQILLKTFTFLAVLCVLGVSSCRRCSDESCKNGGVCESGKCICPQGFFGYSCELTQGNSTALGDLVFYTTTVVNSTCGSYRIEIAASGNQFIYSPNTAATCGTSGSANFTNVPYGSYTYNVYCVGTGALLTTGTVNVNAACIKKVVNPTVSSTGQLSFYATTSSQAMSLCSSPVTVQISGYGNQYVTTTLLAAPSNCTTTGCANFSLPAGSYTATLLCGGSVGSPVLGTYNVTAGSCEKVQLP